MYDGSLIRELEGSSTGTINTVSINDKGTFFVSGGSDRIVKVCFYYLFILERILAVFSPFTLINHLSFSSTLFRLGYKSRRSGLMTKGSAISSELGTVVAF